MGEHNFELKSGQLYFIEPDGSTSLVDHVTDATIETVAEDDYTVAVKHMVDAKIAFDLFTMISKDALLRISGLCDGAVNCVINTCPDRRVAHLAVNGKTARIRKKNFNRAIKILEE